MKALIILSTLTLAAITVPTAWADGLDIAIIGEIRLGRRPPPPPPAVVVVVRESGPLEPSPWEHGRWYQQKQAYYYYPGGDAYYRPADQVWFYLERGQWRYGKHLPEFINIDFGRSISLTMATDRPYMYHQQIMARYPSDYFRTRVRLRDEDRHDRDEARHDRGDARDHDSRGNDDRRHDKDKDKGGRDKSRDQDDRK